MLTFLVLVSCGKSEIAIGLEGNYNVEVNVIKRSWPTSVQNSDDQIHGIPIRGDSVICTSSPDYYSYTFELSIFKQQGKYYIDYGNPLPLSIENGNITYATSEGNSKNGNPFFTINIDKNNLKGTWIRGYNCDQYSLGIIKNGVIEQANIKLVKQ
ncbi:MAG: hypothetical protein KJP21_09465 [Bacteroidia bacterium]|nr:hypothetical protein [Bacteroidia bacterium]